MTSRVHKLACIWLEDLCLFRELTEMVNKNTLDVDILGLYAV
jgi:hypothetical protein